MCSMAIPDAMSTCRKYLLSQCDSVQPSTQQSQPAYCLPQSKQKQWLLHHCCLDVTTERNGEEAVWCGFQVEVASACFSQCLFLLRT